jgi:ribosome-associated protein
MGKDTEQIHHTAWTAIEDKKGLDPVVLDVRELSSVTDYFLMVTGSSAPHVKALAESVERALKETGVRCYRKSGTADSGWIVLDYVDTVVHIVNPETRAFYGLESLWSDAPRLADVGV